MSLKKSNYQKFKRHFEKAGFFYTLWRGISYFTYLIKRYKENIKVSWKSDKIMDIGNVVSQGKIKILCSNRGVNLYYDEIEVTHGVGLNSGINVSGIWTDSSKAAWEILEKGRDYFKLQVSFKDFPIIQIWNLRIKDKQEISWQIEMEIKRDLNIDERRAVCLVSRSYKTWINGYHQGDLPDVPMWRDVALRDLSSRFVGVRFSSEAVSLPWLGLGFSDAAYIGGSPLIQNTPEEINAYIIGLIMVDTEKKNYYLPGKYKFFTGRIILSKDNDYLEKKRNYRGNLKKFLILLRKRGITYALEAITGYLFIKRKDYLIKRTTSKLSKEPLVFFRMRGKSIRRLFYKKIKTIGFIPSFRKMRNNYLDIIGTGIFSKRIALRGPRFVQIDLTNKCNNNCIACWCNSSLLKEKRNDGQSLPYKKVTELIDTLKKMGTKEIYLAGGGEPFIFPQILDVVEYVKKKGLMCYLNTNFTLVDEEIISELIKLKLDYLIVSLWAGTPSMYKLTHPNKDTITFYRMEQMLKFLGQLKEGYPYVCINNVITSLNWQDIRSMIVFALEVKADAINFAVLDVIPGMTDKLLLDRVQRTDVLKKIKKVIRKKKVTERIDFWGIKKFVDRLSNPLSDEGIYDKGLIDNIPCYAGWMFSRILANGDVNACLKAHRIPVGNIHIDNFQKIWDSQKQQEFRNRTCVRGRKDPFFTYIGNDPETEESGCYRSCDDFERNERMNKRIESLTLLEEKLCDWGTGFLSLTKGKQ